MKKQHQHKFEGLTRATLSEMLLAKENELQAVSSDQSDLQIDLAQSEVRNEMTNTAKNYFKEKLQEQQDANKDLMAEKTDVQIELIQAQERIAALELQLQQKEQEAKKQGEVTEKYKESMYSNLFENAELKQRLSPLSPSIKERQLDLRELQFRWEQLAVLTKYRTGGTESDETLGLTIRPDYKDLKGYTYNNLIQNDEKIILVDTTNERYVPTTYGDLDNKKLVSIGFDTLENTDKNWNRKFSVKMLTCGKLGFYDISEGKSVSKNLKNRESKLRLAFGDDYRVNSDPSYNYDIVYSTGGQLYKTGLDGNEMQFDEKQKKLISSIRQKMKEDSSLYTYDEIMMLGHLVSLQSHKDQIIKSSKTYPEILEDKKRAELEQKHRGRLFAPIDIELADTYLTELAAIQKGMGNLTPDQAQKMFDEIGRYIKGGYAFIHEGELKELNERPLQIVAETQQAKDAGTKQPVNKKEFSKKLMALVTALSLATGIGVGVLLCHLGHERGGSEIPAVTPTTTITQPQGQTQPPHTTVLPQATIPTHTTISPHTTTQLKPPVVTQPPVVETQPPHQPTVPPIETTTKGPQNTEQPTEQVIPNVPNGAVHIGVIPTRTWGDVYVYYHEGKLYSPKWGPKTNGLTMDGFADPRRGNYPPTVTQVRNFVIQHENSLQASQGVEGGMN
jgi:hypothetical protein